LTKRSFYVIIKLVGLGRSTSGLVEGQAHRTPHSWQTISLTLTPICVTMIAWYGWWSLCAYRDLLFVSYTPIPYTHLVSLSVARWAHNLWSIVHEP